MPANPQELRNCIVIMVSPNYGAFMRSLAEYEPFLKVLSASEDQLEKQRHMEYVSRFLVHTYLPYDGKLDVEEFIDEGIVELAQKGETNDAGSTFRKTFELLNGAYGDGALKRIQNGVPHGRVGLAALECIAVGVAKNLTAIEAKQTPLDYVRKRIAEFWQAPQLSFFFSAGLRGTIRLQRTVPFGTEWFST